MSNWGFSSIHMAVTAVAWGFCGGMHAQQVSRLEVRPSPEFIEIGYRLEADRPLTVQLYCSGDGGGHWTGPLQAVSGDVGERVAAGENYIQWRFAEEVAFVRPARLQFEVRTGRYVPFTMKFRNGWFNMPRRVSSDFELDDDMSAFRLRQMKGWNSVELKAPSGNYDFEIHHEPRGRLVESEVQLKGGHGRRTGLGMLVSAILPGMGIQYVTFGDAMRWSESIHGRPAKRGYGQFWSVVLSGGGYLLARNFQQRAYDEAFAQPGGSASSAMEAARRYAGPKWALAGMAGFFYIRQIVQVSKWNKTHRADMDRFTSAWK